MRKATQLVLLAGMGILSIMGCQRKEPAKEPPAQVQKETPPPAEPKARMVPQLSRADVNAVTFKPGEKPRVKLETSLGTITAELWPEVAPLHCKNFVYLTQKGFFDSVLVHRVIPGFVLQTGDPLGNGSGGPGYTIEAEFSDQKHLKGTLSMARTSDPNSAGSQFFVCLGPVPRLDGQYSVFGQTVEGLDVLDKFNQVQTVPNEQGEKSRPATPIYLIKATMLL